MLNVDLQQSSAVFAALGDPTRLALVDALSDGRTRSITALAADSELTRQGVTKHLAALHRAGLVARRRRGRETHYALQPQTVAAARAYLDAVSKQWEDALQRLKSFAEADV